MDSIALRQVWNVFFDSMILTNADGDLLHMNRSARRLFSLHSENMHDTSVFELLPIELEKYLVPQKETSGISLSFGTEELILNVAPVNHHFLLIFKNIAQEQRLKYELKVQHDTMHIYELVLNELNEGVSVINQDGKVIFYNKKMGEIDLREPESVKNKFLIEAFPDSKAESSGLLKSLQLEKTLNHRETHFSNGGKTVTTMSKTLPLQLGSRKIGAAEILNDITKQKSMEDTIRQLQKQSNQPSLEDRQRLSSNNTRFLFENIVFKSAKMRHTVELARRTAKSSSNVLLIGETGTGKELFAQSIHNGSTRRNKKFIAQNCAALPENLLEGLLFGTSVGSFTGAIDREGILEQAHNGTLLLDEINSMGLNLQAKLLRFLQEKRIKRLGSNKEISTNVRIIATINEDPHEAIKNGRLREDLYYRLSVVNLVIQPLRERKEDIPVLIDHFIEKHAKALDIAIDGIDDGVLDFFLEFSWPGNVRQLEHAIEGALNLVHNEKVISFDHLSSTFQGNMPEQAKEKDPGMYSQSYSVSNGTLDEQKILLERNLIGKALKKNNGNITRASEMLGISRQNLNYKLKKHGFH